MSRNGNVGATAVAERCSVCTHDQIWGNKIQRKPHIGRQLCNGFECCCCFLNSYRHNEFLQVRR